MLAVLTKWQLTAPVGGSEGTQQLLHGDDSPPPTAGGPPWGQEGEHHCMVVGSCIPGKACKSESDCDGLLCIDHANCMDQQQGGAPVVAVAEVARDVGDAGGATASASPPPPYATGGTAYGGYPGGSGDGIH